MGFFFDAAETAEPAAREAALFAALPAALARVRERAPYYAERLAGHDLAAVTSREALARLPVTRKSALHALQAAAPPFGGLLAVPPGTLARLFLSPGPIHDAEGRAPDYWGTARALFAAGFRAGDIVHNCFSYHLTPAGSMFETGAHALGCAVIPGGTGQTEQQVAAIAALKPAGYVGTPSFLKLILARARELGADMGSLKRALVSGEALLPAVRAEFAEAGIDTFQAYGTADLGLVAYETAARQGLVVAEGIVVEIVRPGTGEPVAPGEVGEVVVTAPRADYPLIRFATGDLSRMLDGPSPCGRTNVRLQGWMGRADQSTKVRGMFVHPHQVAEIVGRHPGVGRARLVVSHVDGADAMQLLCESANGLDAESVSGSVREVTKLRGEVRAVAPGSLPDDGKVIEDTRRME